MANCISPEASSRISDYLTLPTTDYLTNPNTNAKEEEEDDDDNDDEDDESTPTSRKTRSNFYAGGRLQ